MEAITKRSGNEVFSNIPKLVVGEMPWQEAPTCKGRLAKQGPVAREVDKLYRSRSASAKDRAE